MAKNRVKKPRGKRVPVTPALRAAVKSRVDETSINALAAESGASWQTICALAKGKRKWCLASVRDRLLRVVGVPGQALRVVEMTSDDEQETLPLRMVDPIESEEDDAEAVSDSELLAGLVRALPDDDLLRLVKPGLVRHLRGVS